ncbi:MAG TPA: hypothetical protein PKA81_02560 [Clostridia bacterium]|nr:hypothetical protein [Clostridia bacterium]
MNPKQKTALTKVFAVSGTVVLWAPILFLFVTAIVGSIAGKALLFDYLMLAELFPIVALGLILLVLASLLSRTFRKWFGWGSVAALLALTGAQILATASGLASGALAESGGVFATVIAAIVIYNVIVGALAILAMLLLRRLFQKQPQEAAAE